MFAETTLGSVWASWWGVFFLVFPGVGFRPQSKCLCTFMAHLVALEARKRSGWIGRDMFGVVFDVFSRQISFRLEVGVYFSLFSLMSVFVRNPGFSVPSWCIWGLWKLGNGLVGSGENLVGFSLFFLSDFIP